MLQARISAVTSSIIAPISSMSSTLKILATTFDLRIPLTFSVEDMELIGAIIDEVTAEILA